MEGREKYKRLIRLAFSALNIAAMTSVYAYFWFHYYHERQVIGILYFKWGHLAILFLYAVMFSFFTRVYGARKIGYLRTLDLLLSQFLSVLIVNAITYIQLALIGRWTFGLHMGPLVGMTVIDFAVAVLWVVFSRYTYALIFPARKILLIYGDRSPISIINKLATRRDKYEITETASVEEETDEEICAKIERFSSVMVGDIPAQKRNDYLKYCYERNIRCYTVPKISDIMMMSSETINLFDTSLQLFRNQGLSADQQFVKRIMDIVCSLLMLIVASPFMALIALCIWGYDKGPVFYKQERLTLGGRKFMIYKFRSMVVNSEAKGARLAARGDSRITPVGRIIRNLHLDELPQLINILKGDMSLVGPRPERPSIAKQYAAVVPEFAFRLKVKAGLTGFAQVYGKYNTTPYDKLKLDLYYIQNYSIWMDLKLCMLTFKILFQKENTEGVDPSQRTAADQVKKEKSIF